MDTSDVVGGDTHQELPSVAAISPPIALLRLLSAAKAALYDNREIANDCIVRASALLRTSFVGGTSPMPDEKPPLGGLAPWQAKRVCAYIAAHLAGKICATDLALVASLSTSHFFRAFRETFQEAPMAYVARQRMRHAQALLLASSDSLSQVALACGLFDQAHFTRTFRRVVGLSPGAWRRAFSVGATEPKAGHIL